MKNTTLGIRRLLPLLALALAGCSDFFYEAASGVPVQLALSYRLADGAALAPALSSPGEAFDRADRARVRVLQGSQSLFDEVVDLDSEGADKSAQIELVLEEVVTLNIVLDLREGETSLFTGTTTAQITPGVSADIVVPLNPVAAGLTIAEGDQTLSKIGETVQLTARTFFATGETLEQVSAAWSASGSAVSISDAGVVTALENGESTVTASFGDFEASALVTVFDPCTVDAKALNFGAAESESLRAGEDCLDAAAGWFVEFWAMLVDQDAPFQVTMQSGDFTPLHGFFGGSDDQITGLISSTTREYVLPALPNDLYFLMATSTPDVANPPQGDYSLAADYVSEPQVGCIPTTMVTFGSKTSGNVTSSDCEDEFDGQAEVIRWWDGYTILLLPGESVTVTITSDFDTWYTYWRLDEFISGNFDHSIGEPHSFTVSGDDGPFHSFYVISRFNEGTGGYSIEFSGSGGGAAGASRPVLYGG